MVRKKRNGRIIDFIPGIFGSMVFVLLCILFFVSGFKGESSYLSLSLDKPWGIFTSTYVHADFNHLWNNISAILIFSSMIFVVNMWVPKKIRKTISSTMLVLLFFTGPLVGSLEYLIWLATSSFDVSSVGASDVVYAVSALALVSFGLNIPIFWKVSSGRRKSRAATFLFIVGIFIVFIFFFSLIQSPEVFFSVAPGVDVLAHVFGFIIGLLVSFRFLLPVYRRLM
ncbi:MAG: rhomboid family intramembrane serine protease [Candidatus Hadarchaeales archaeon]